MRKFAVWFIGECLLSRNAIHTATAGASVVGIGAGFWMIHPPTALIVVSLLFLSGIIYARTR